MSGIGRAIIAMPVKVAHKTEIPPGTMKRVAAFKEHILLSNVAGKI
jgi:hypothetical protein